MDLDEAIERIKDLEATLELTDKLLDERTKVIDSIPPCVAHGRCIPHALEWIAKVKTLAKVINNED